MKRLARRVLPLLAVCLMVAALTSCAWLNQEKTPVATGNGTTPGSVSSSGTELPAYSTSPITAPVGLDTLAVDPDTQPIPGTTPASDTEPVTIPVSDTKPVTIPVSDTEPVTIPVSDTEPVTIPVSDTEPVTIPVSDTEPVTIPVSDTEPVETSPITEPVHTHKYTAKTVAATCTEDGYTLHTCTCGNSYKDATVKALGHSWDNGVITKAATETAEGIKTYTCSRCKTTKTEVVAKLTHTHKYTTKVVAPTCTADGYTIFTCTCGNSYKDATVKALGHSYGAWTVTKAATSTAEGVETRTCTRCGNKETRAIEKLAHTHSYTVKTVVATCTDAGYTLHSCSVCGDSYKDGNVAALGHSWNSGVITTPATEAAAGVKTYTCSRCQTTKTEVIPKLEQTASSQEQEVFRLVNEERAKEGLPALRYCSEAQAAADLRAKEIMTLFDHTRPDGSSCFTVFSELGIPSSLFMCGENIAAGYPTPTDVMNGWMNSPGHRSNILSTNATGIVIGFVRSGGYLYWVQLFVM